jgi:hypothetical protein
MATDAYTISVPSTCVVPAVLNEAGDANAREAVTYYTVGPDLAGTTASGGLATESEDGTSKWTATVYHVYTTAAEVAESNFQSHDRTQAGQVAWYTGNLRQATWTENMRKHEQTFWGSVNSARATALAAATKEADDASHDVANPSPFDITTAGDPGAAKALETARGARDQTSSSNPGSGYSMSAARAQSSTSGEEWKTVWTDGHTAMNAWKAANNSVKGNAWLWFEKAAILGDAVAAWHTNWTTNADKLTVGNGAFTEEL